MNASSNGRISSVWVVLWALIVGAVVPAMASPLLPDHAGAGNVPVTPANLTGNGSVTVPSLGFGPPAPIGVAASGAMPRIALSSPSNGVAVFTDVPTATGQLHAYARQLIGGVWQQAKALGIGWPNAYYPDIALSSDGNGVAVFTASDLTTTFVIANNLNRGVWTGDYGVDRGLANVQRLPPHVATSSDGNGMVVFSVGQDSYAATLSSWSWQSPVKISSGSINSGMFPAVQLSSDGNGLVVFNNPSGNHIARPLVNGAWQAPQYDDCGSALEYESYLSLAYDGTGLVASGSCDLHGAVNVLVDNQVKPGLRLFIQQVRIFPRASIAPDGSGMAIYGPISGHVTVNRFDGVAWQGGSNLDQDLTAYTNASASDIALTYNSNGAAIFYKQDSAGMWHLFARRLAHGVWQSSELIGSTGVPTNTYQAPKVAVAPDGSAVIVFGENGHIYATTYTAPPEPAARLRPRKLDFGTVHAGLTSESQVVTVTNVGSAPLTITNATITGANPGDFSVTPNRAGSMITPGASVTMNIAFAPTLTGTRTATFTVSDNTYDSPHHVALRGFGANPAAISIQQDAVCQGLVVQVRGNNFPAFGAVQISFDLTPVVTVTTDVVGGFVAYFTVPPNPGGMHTISAADLATPGAQDAIPVRTPTPGLPIVFIPGVSGSAIEAQSSFTYLAPPDLNLFPLDINAGVQEQHIYSAGERIWLNSTGTTQALGSRSRYFDALRLQPDGIAPMPDVNGTVPNLAVNGVLFDVPGINVFGYQIKYTDVYSGLRNYLVAQGYTEGQNLFYFAYDWRKDLGPTAGDLDALINQALSASGQNQVVLLAHSMGGLVARNYLLQFGTSKVDQLITLGAPYLGAPKVVKALEVGDDWGIGWHTAFDLGVGMHPKELMKMAQNYPSAYELGPSQEWFNSQIDPDPNPQYIVRSSLINGNLTTEPLDFAGTESFVASRHNARLLSDAESFHNQPIGDMTLPSDFYFDQRIIGVDVPTLGHIAYTPHQAVAQVCLSPLGPCWTVTVPLPELVILKSDMLGDGTVPLHSAMGSNRRKGDFRFYYLSGVAHMDLPSDSKAQFLMGEMLNGRMCSNGQNPFVLRTQSKTTVPEAAATGLLSPTSTTGTLVQVIGDADLNVYDALGRHTGPISQTLSGTEMGIPRIGYDATDHSQTAMIANSGAYTVVVRGKRQNSAAMLRFSAMSQGAISETWAYEGIPVTATTIATLTLQSTIPGGPVNPALSVLYDVGWPSQPVNVISILTGTASQDITPPGTSILVDAGRNVTITAADDPGGSGIWRIYYSTEQPPIHYVVYTGTFTLAANTSVTAFAVDRAGNAGYPPAYYPKVVFLPLIDR